MGKELDALNLALGFTEVYSLGVAVWMKARDLYEA